MSLQIKLLVWEPIDNGECLEGTGDYYLCHQAGRYWVHRKASGDMRGRDGKVVFYDDRAEAKAAAQADYETRIRSALAPSVVAEPTPDRSMQDGAAYADTSPVTDERLDWLARHGSTQTITPTEIRYIAEELWQFRKGQVLRDALAVRAAPPPMEGMVLVPEDLLTHISDWRNACQIARFHAKPASAEEDDPSYWEHQLKTLDKIEAALSRAATPNHPEPGAGK